MKRSLFFILFFALISSASPAWAINLSGTGSLPRGSATELQLTLEISNVAIADLVNSDAEDTIRDKIEVYLEDLSASKRVRYTDEPANEVFVDGYTVEISNAEMQDEPTGTKLMEATLTIQQNATPEKTLEELVVTGAVRVRLKYQPVTGEAEEKIVSADQKLGVVDEAPSNVQVLPQHLGLAVSWDALSDVAYNVGDADTPTSAKVILIDTSVATSLSFDATTFQEDPADESVDTTCAFTADVAAGTCELEECPDAHLDLDQIATLEGVRISTATHPTSNVAFTDLDPAVSYAVITVLEPDGLKRSACVIGQPKVNTSFIELNGGKAAEAGNPYCFIATAAYGSSLHPHLDTLRWFRDTALLSTSWGRSFVDAYYEYAPPLAGWLERHDSARAVVRVMLWPLVTLIEAIRGE